jgi:hypothetical protein
LQKGAREERWYYVVCCEIIRLVGRLESCEEGEREGRRRVRAGIRMTWMGGPSTERAVRGWVATTTALTMHRHRALTARRPQRCQDVQIRTDKSYRLGLSSLSCVRGGETGARRAHRNPHTSEICVVHGRLLLASPCSASSHSWPWCGPSPSPPLLCVCVAVAKSKRFMRTPGLARFDLPSIPTGSSSMQRKRCGQLTRRFEQILCQRASPLLHPTAGRSRLDEDRASHPVNSRRSRSNHHLHH